MVPELHEVYDEETLEVLDGWRSGSERSGQGDGGGWRRRTVAGAVVGALAIGAREALTPRRDDEPAVLEVDPGTGIDPTQPVSVWFVPGEPAATVALVRPWRWPSRRRPAIPEAVIPPR